MNKKKTYPIRIPRNIAKELETDYPDISWSARITIIHRTHRDLKNINNFLFGKVPKNVKKK